MDIIKAYAVNNLCYKAAQKMTPKGIVVHSTGANNPYLKSPILSFSRRRVAKKNLKIFSKRFGDYKNNTYLCTR